MAKTKPTGRKPTPHAVALDTTMTSQEAAAYLTSLPAVESGLSARLVGVSDMVLGLGLIGTVAIQSTFGVTPFLRSQAPTWTFAAGIVGSMLFLFATLFVSMGVFRSGGLGVPRNPWSGTLMRDQKKGVLLGLAIGVVGTILVAVLMLLFKDSPDVLDWVAKSFAVAFLSTLLVLGRFVRRRYHPHPTILPIVIGCVMAILAIGLLWVGNFGQVFPWALVWLASGQFVQGFLLYLRS